MSVRVDVVVEKIVEDVYVVGFSPRVRVVLRVLASRLPRTKATVVEKIPPQARPVDHDPAFRVIESSGGSRLLVADLDLSENEERLLAYVLEFNESFDGFLEPAAVVVGSLSFSSQRARLKVKKVVQPAVVPLRVEGLVPGGLVAETAASRPPCISFEEIPFHSQTKEKLKQALDSGLWILIKGRPGLWKSRLVLAAACYLRERGYRMCTANDIGLGLQSGGLIVVALPNLDQHLGVNPFLALQLQQLRSVEGAVVVASMSSEWNELEERLSRILGSSAVEALRQVFTTIEVVPPIFEEIAEFLRRELSSFLTEEALSLRWLSASGLTCEKVEALAKGIKAKSQKENRKLSPSDCSSILSGILLGRIEER
jgi:hypothetical protein